MSLHSKYCTIFLVKTFQVVLFEHLQKMFLENKENWKKLKLKRCQKTHVLGSELSPLIETIEAVEMMINSLQFINEILQHEDLAMSWMSNH